MTEKRSVGSANLTIELVDRNGVAETLTLKPTIAAARQLSRRHGGLRGVIDKLQGIDLDLVIEVIEAGLGAPPNVKHREELAEKIFASGMTDDTGRLPELCVNYVLILMRGGRPLPVSASNGVADLSSEAEGEPYPPTLPASP